MTSAAGASRVRLRLVVDPGVFVSALISAKGPPRRLLEAAVAGRITVIVSPLLLGELVPDPPGLPGGLRQPVCRDPDDDYLVALAEAADTTFLVSGDRDLIELEYGPVVVRSPHAVVAVLNQPHAWGAAFVPGSDEESRRRAQAEGHDRVLRCAGSFIVLLNTGDSEIPLADLVTPESLPTWAATMESARARLAGREGVTSRPEYPTTDIAYVRVVPYPGAPTMATAEVMIDSPIILTLQRRPELLETNDLGGWRVHGLGGYYPIDQMPSTVGPLEK